MINFDQESFNNFIIDNNVVGFKEDPFTLKSGRKSHWYVNWRTVSNDAFLLDQLSDFVLFYVKNQDFVPDVFYGVPEGATKLGVITQYKWAKMSTNFSKGSDIIAMGRGKPKDHGDPKDRYFIGEPQGKIIILEDVTTTGGSLLDTIDFIQEMGSSNILAAIGLTNRMEVRDDKKSVKEAVEEKGVTYFSLSNAFQILPEAYKKLNPGEKIARAIEEEFQQYGVKPITLR